MSLDSTVFRIAASLWSGVCCAVTVTCSVTAPVSNAKSIVIAAVASSVTLSRTTFLKPCSSALMLYTPASKFGNV